MQLSLITRDLIISMEATEEEDDDDDTTAAASTTAVANNKSDDSESDFVTYKFTPQKRGRKPKKKISNNDNHN